MGEQLRKSENEDERQPDQDDYGSFDILTEGTKSSTASFEDLAAVPFAGAVKHEQASNEMPPEDAKKAELPPISPEELERQRRNHEGYKKFLKMDLSIKRDMIEAAPSDVDDSTEDARMDYAEQAYKDFRGLRMDFRQIDRAFGGDTEAGKAIEQFFRRKEADFAIGRYDYGTPGKLYRKVFSDLRPEFVEEVKKQAIGYYLFGGDLTGLIGQAQTVNEVLHAYHQCLMNNNEMLESMPLLDQDKKSEYVAVNLRGDESALGREMFEGMKDVYTDGTDIVAFDDRITMMVRGSGHALVVEAEPAEEDPEGSVVIHYHIPKICNLSMVEALPGIGKITSEGAHGVFTVPREGAGAAIAEFVKKVPTDMDMGLSGSEYLAPGTEMPVEQVGPTLDEIAVPMVQEEANPQAAPVVVNPPKRRGLFGKLFKRG